MSAMIVLPPRRRPNMAMGLWRFRNLIARAFAARASVYGSLGTYAASKMFDTTRLTHRKACLG
jgi:hypothetical protein